MSKLKTVERESNLKLIEKRLNTLKNSTAELEDSLKIVKDEIKDTRCEIDRFVGKICKLDSSEHGYSNKVKERQEKIDVLEIKLEPLYEQREEFNVKIRENKSEIKSLEKEIVDFKTGSNKRFSVRDHVKRGIKGAAAVGINTAKSAVKSGFTKVDPLSGNINKDDITDSGMESIRLARQGAKKTANALKTTKKTIKTTVRGIKTAKNVAVTTTKTTYKVAEKTAKAVVFTGKIIIKAVTHIAALLVNPIFWIIAGILIVVTLLSSLIIMLMGTAGSGQSTMAATGAVGLGDVSGQYMQGVEYRETALQNEQNAHNALINAASGNDLIYMQVTRADGTQVQYSTTFATAAQKNFLNSAPWTYPLNENLLGVNDTLAIAYVLLQKRENAAKGTTGVIYNVTFTQEILSEIIGLSAAYNSTTYTGQTCPGANCSSYTDEYGTHYYCPGNHNLYAIGVWYYSKATVMERLGFTQAEREWVAMTVSGFEANPNIP